MLIMLQLDFNPCVLLHLVDEDTVIIVWVTSELHDAHAGQNKLLRISLEDNRVLNFHLVSAPILAGCGKDAITRMILIEECILSEIMLLLLPLPVVNDLACTHVDLRPVVIPAIVDEDAAVPVPVRHEEHSTADNLLVGQTGRRDVLRSENFRLTEGGRVLKSAMLVHKHAFLWVWHFEELLNCLGSAKICLAFFIDDEALVLAIEGLGVELALQLFDLLHLEESALLGGYLLLL